MPNPLKANQRAEARTISRKPIVPQASAPTQYLDGNSERSLPALTNIIEFLEWIEPANPFIQRIAIKLYAKFTAIDQQHLHHIATLRCELAEDGAL